MFIIIVITSVPKTPGPKFVRIPLTFCVGKATNQDGDLQLKRSKLIVFMNHLIVVKLHITIENKNVFFKQSMIVLSLFVQLFYKPN